MEGQFQFVLAPKLKSDVIIDDISYQWPKFTNTVTLLGPNAQRNPSGIFNSNAEPNVSLNGLHAFNSNPKRRNYFFYCKCKL